VIDLAKRFSFRSEYVNKLIEEDVEQIEELIRKERKHEAKLTSGSVAWEITKEGARQGERFIAAADVSVARWGAVVTREQSGSKSYDFLLDLEAEDGQWITYSWKTSQEIERHHKHFQDLIGAALNYLLPTIIARAEKRLAAGYPLQIGPCKVTNGGVEFDVKGWVFTDRHTVPWHRVRVSLESGDVIVQDAQAPKTKISFSLRDTDNAPILQYLANTRNGRDD